MSSTFIDNLRNANILPTAMCRKHNTIMSPFVINGELNFECHKCNQEAASSGTEPVHYKFEDVQKRLKKTLTHGIEAAVACQDRPLDGKKSGISGQINKAFQEQENLAVFFTWRPDRESVDSLLGDEIGKEAGGAGASEKGVFWADLGVGYDVRGDPALPRVTKSVCANCHNNTFGRDGTGEWIFYVLAGGEASMEALKIVYICPCCGFGRRKFDK